MANEVLYSFVDGDNTVYATKCGMNSSGELILEVKGTGQIVTKSKEDVEEVFPFTFGVKFNNTGKEYHFMLANNKRVKVGDVLLRDDYMSFDGHMLSIAIVTSVDTKNRQATKEFGGYKLVTEKL
jgi:hypothetical protein